MARGIVIAVVGAILVGSVLYIAVVDRAPNSVSAGMDCNSRVQSTLSALKSLANKTTDAFARAEASLPLETKGTESNFDRLRLTGEENLETRDYAALESWPSVACQSPYATTLVTCLSLAAPTASDALKDPRVERQILGWIDPQSGGGSSNSSIAQSIIAAARFQLVFAEGTSCISGVGGAAGRPAKPTVAYIHCIVASPSYPLETSCQ